MPNINNKTLRDATWKQVYRYTGAKVSFITYACEEIPGLTITKDMLGAKVVKTTYTVAGKATDSPTQAVRDYNAHQRAQSGRQEVPGSPRAAGLR